MPLVFSSEQESQQQQQSSPTPTSAAVNNNNNLDERSRSTSSSTSSSSGSSGSAGVPWDQRKEDDGNNSSNNHSDTDKNNHKNTKDLDVSMRTTTTVYEPHSPTISDPEEDLNDGQLPSLTPKNGNSANNSISTSPPRDERAVGSGSILIGPAMPTKRLMHPPSQAGAAASSAAAAAAAAAVVSTQQNPKQNKNNRAQQRKFWGQLDEERQAQNHVPDEDDDDDGPDDEIAARRAARAILYNGRYDGDYDNDYDHGYADDEYQQLGGVESQSLSQNSNQGSIPVSQGETMTLDSEEQAAAEAAEAQTFCGQTLSALGDICGGNLALADSADGGAKRHHHTDKTRSSRLGGIDIRDDPPGSYTHRNSKLVEQQQEHTAIEVEFVEPRTSQPNASKKNAYLTAMARKAKSDFDKGQAGGDGHSSTTAAVVIGPSASMDIYGSFNAQEKRKFLKLINSGASPLEASQQIVQEREAAAQKKQEKSADKKGRGGPRLAFWRKGKNKKGKKHQQGAEHEEGEDESMASSSQRQASKTSGDSSATSSGAGTGVEGESQSRSRSDDSSGPPPPPPPPDRAPDSTALSPRPSSTNTNTNEPSSKPMSILKKQQAAAAVVTPTSSPKQAPASPTSATSATSSASRHYHEATSSDYARGGGDSSSLPSKGRDYLTQPTSPGGASAHSMPMTPGVSAYLTAASTGAAGYVSPVSASQSAYSAPVSAGDSTNAADGDKGRQYVALSPPLSDRKIDEATPRHRNYTPPTQKNALPAAAVAAMKSLDLPLTSPKTALQSQKNDIHHDFAGISPLISRPDVDHDGSEVVDEDELYGASGEQQQPRSEVSEFAPSGINYYDAVRRDPHSDVDDELEAVIASVARGSGKNAKGSNKLRKPGNRLPSGSKPRGFSALKDRPRLQLPHRPKSTPRGMRLAERSRSVSPSPPISPPSPIPHVESPRGPSSPRAQSEPGVTSTGRSRATPNSAKASILQSAARSLKQAKLSESARKAGSAPSSSTGYLMDTHSQDTDASSAHRINWVEEEVIRRNASQRSGLSSSLSGDNGFPPASTDETRSLPVVTPTQEPDTKRSQTPRSSTPAAVAVGSNIERTASPPSGSGASIAHSDQEQEATPTTDARPPRGKQTPGKEGETYLDTNAMEVDMDTYLSSMDAVSSQHSAANFDAQSVYTSATGTSTYTQSSRKRRPGAAKDRLAKTKEANQKKNGWHESIRAAATKTNREWEPDSGWKDYHDPDSVAPKSEEKLRVHLGNVRSKDGATKVNDLVIARSSDETVDTAPVPFPKEWEAERDKMLGQDAENFVKSITATRETKERPMTANKTGKPISTEPRATSKIEMSPVRREAAPLLETKPSVEEDITETLPPIDRDAAPSSLNRPPRVAERTTSKRIGGASPHRARPEEVAPRPIGWLESMRAASAAFATEGRSWDPETGWVASGDDEDDEDVSVPDVVDFDAPSADAHSNSYSEPRADSDVNDAVHQETIANSIPVRDEPAKMEQRPRVLPLSPRETDGKLKQWVEKSEKTTRDFSVEDSDRAVASSAATEIYMQLGDNGSVRSQKDTIPQDGANVSTTVADTVDFGAAPEQGENARSLDNSYIFPAEDDRPISPVIRIKKEKIAAEELSLFPPAESQEKRDGRRVAAAVAAAAKRDKLKQAREAKYSKEARAALEYEQRREAARAAGHAIQSHGEPAKSSQKERMAAALKSPPPPPPPAPRVDPPKQTSLSPRSTHETIGLEAGQHSQANQTAPPSPPSPPLTKASGPITPSPQPPGRLIVKPHTLANEVPRNKDENFGKQKPSGPIDIDEVNHDWDSEEDQPPSNNGWDPNSSVSRSRLTTPVPKLKASKRDTSPVRVRRETSAAPARSSPERQNGSSPTEEQKREIVTERAISSAEVAESGESYVERQVIKERVVTRNNKVEVVEREATTTRGTKKGGRNRDDFKQVKSEDEDSLFEFGDKKEASASALVHSRLSPIKPNKDELDILDASKTPSETASVSDAYGPDPSDGRTFLQRLSECAAPVMAGKAKGAKGDLPAAHLAFLSSNHVQGSKATGGRFVPPNLCGRPDIIQETDEADYKDDGEESVHSQPAQTLRTSTPPPVLAQRPKSAPRDRMRTSDGVRTGDAVRPTSSSSVVSEDFGAKTAYLEAIAMKTAVSKPRRGDSKRRGRSSGSSVASGASSQHSEKWKAFLERKRASDPSPQHKSRGSSTSEVSKAAERYAAAKLEEMMAKMSEQSKAGQVPNVEGLVRSSSSHSDGDDGDCDWTDLDSNGNTRAPHPSLLRKEKAELDSYVHGHALEDHARRMRQGKTESVSAAHDLAAARVEAMMAALSNPEMDDEAEI